MDRFQVVMEVRPLSTMQGITTLAKAWAAVTPGTSPPQIMTTRIGQKNIATSIETLGMAGQPATQDRQRFEVGIIRHRYEQVSVFWIWLIGGQRTNQRDAQD